MEKSAYEAPTITDLGSLSEVTLGNNFGVVYDFGLQAGTPAFPPPGGFQIGAVSTV
jgi:hypothetical protein